MRDRGHTHRCEHCNADVPCGGTYERNYDGFPEAWCDAFHGRPTDTPFICEDCWATQCESGQSENCVQYGALLTFIPHEGTPAQEKPIRVCPACLTWEQDAQQRGYEEAEQRGIERFYGSSDPQTDRERCETAYEQKRALKHGR